MPRRADPAVVLPRFGLAPGPAGWLLADLADLALDAGLTAVVEPHAPPTAGRRFRALVYRPADPRADLYGSRAARGYGASEEAALASALAAVLERESAVQPVAS